MQSRLGSLLESCANTASGFVISWIVWVWVAGPLAGLQTNVKNGFLVTTLMTVTSLLRSYFWRRLFNHREKR